MVTADADPRGTLRVGAAAPGACARRELSLKLLKMATEAGRETPGGDLAGTEFVPCNLCGSVRYTVVLEANTTGGDLRPEAIACTSPDIGKHDRIVRCDNCGLMFVNPRPARGRVEDAYSAVEDVTYLREEAARVATFRHSLLGVRKHEPSGRLLDVGCYVGTFLEIARDAGYEVAGVEPSRWAASYARKAKGLDVRTGGLAEAGLPTESFDVVTLWDVIEHLTDPLEELRQIHRALRPGGLFALTTMNVDSLPPKLLRGRWPWFMQMHLYYFTPETVSRMLREAGFEVVEIGPHIRITHLRYLASKAGSYSPPLGRAAARILARLGLEEARLPINFGDLMTVYARKV
jgi:2-polyprenyl-3-methyl-5-hydroxy-6-metoxy-1,4-benzoquinol methylase